MAQKYRLVIEATAYHEEIIEAEDDEEAGELLHDEIHNHVDAWFEVVD